MEGTDYDEMLKLFIGRNKLIQHNNYCIIEIIAFYDHVFFDKIIKTYLFNENIDINDDIKDDIKDSMSFNTKYKIVKKISKKLKIEPISQKKMEKFEDMRNNVSHNLCSINNYNIENDEMIIIFGNKTITWDEYKKELKEWVDICYEIAKWTKKIYEKIEIKFPYMHFVYCKLEGECMIVQHQLLVPEPEGDYTSFFKTGFDMDLLDYLKNEINHNA